MNRELRAIILSLILLLIPFSGCLGNDEKTDNSEEDYYPSIWDRNTLEWNTTHTHSFLLNPGPHYALEVQ
jgi:hypothetical protein